MSDVQRQGVPPKWTKWTKPEEDQRLTVLEGRINRRLELAKDDQKERRKIMMRAVRRMRRASGKA